MSVEIINVNINVSASCLMVWVCLFIRAQSSQLCHWLGSETSNKITVLTFFCLHPAGCPQHMCMSEVLHWSLGPQQRSCPPIRGEPDTSYQVWEIWLANRSQTVMNTKSVSTDSMKMFCGLVGMRKVSSSPVEPLNKNKWNLVHSCIKCIT